MAVFLFASSQSPLCSASDTHNNCGAQHFVAIWGAKMGAITDLGAFDYLKSRPPLASKIAAVGWVAIQFLLLLLAFKINRKIEASAPSAWIFLPLVLMIWLARFHVDETARPVVRLWQLIGLVAGIYSLFQYPLIPLMDDSHSTRELYAVLVIAWIASVASGVFCFWVPSLSLFAPCFLLWRNSIAELVSGLPITIHTDILPLTEISMCIGLGLLISKSLASFQSRWDSFFDPVIVEHAADPTIKPKFVELLFLIAIAIHLANYFWSFWAKVSLDGPLLAWLTENNPARLFIVALDDGHVLFSGYPLLVEWTYRTLDATHLVSNLWILCSQAAALAAFFFPKRVFIALLILFDVMHLSIIAIVGANFLPWILLNLAIAYVVACSDIKSLSIVIRLVATGFILIAPRFVGVAALGWYDSGVNNKLSLEAVDQGGRHYHVPENYFTFYSYSFGHMDYGLPNPAIGVDVFSPNGAVLNYRLFRAGQTCDINALARNKEFYPFEPQRFATFVKNYHRLSLWVSQKIGDFPYDLYPHHHYVPLAIGADFRNLNKQDIVAYIYKQETVCPAFIDGKLQRNLLQEFEYRIDVNDIKPR